jgi:2'-5' RNA ligase
MPRLFTAIEIPAAVADALAAARGGIYGARWREPDDYHITLRFIGDVDARMASEIADALDAVRKSPVSIQFDGLNWFGGEKPRAIVARIKPTPGLIDLQANTSAGCVASGCRRRPGTSHRT